MVLDIKNTDPVKKINLRDAFFRFEILYNPVKLKFVHSIYRVYGTQSDRLELTISVQKSVFNNMHRVLRHKLNRKLKLVTLSTMNLINGTK